MTSNNKNYSRTSYHDFILDSSKTIDLSNITIDNSSNNTMYYTTDTGTIDTITMSTGNSSWGSYQGDISTWSFPELKDFEHTMPSLTKVEEMCTMYPALDKAFENFKAIYDLVKDDYQARKNNDS